MNIGIFQTGSLKPGGAEYVVHHTANCFSRMGDSVIVFAGLPLLKKRPLAIYQIHSHEYQIYQFTCPIMKGISRPWAKYNLIRTAKFKKLDIIHAHTLHTSALIAVKTKKYHHVPVLVTAHGEDIQIDKRLNYGYRLKKRHDRAVRHVLHNADGATAISRAMANEMIDAGAKAERVWIVPNGIDSQSLIRKDSNSQCEKPYLFAMGRFIKKKGFDILIRAFKIALENNRTDIHLIIAGDGPKREELIGLARDLNIGDRIEFVGFLNEQKKAEYLYRAKAFICPSIREPLGIVNLEAMAAGKAIIGSDVDGIPDLVSDGENGFLFKAGETGELAACIARILQNDEMVRQMGESGYKKAYQYTWDKIALKYHEIYEYLSSESCNKRV
jgi:glycosyltransferase involved in cell wall biosynthesis